MLSFLKKIISPSALHDAISDKNEKTALQLIGEKYQIHHFYRGYNPLQLSLLYDLFHCTVQLLELGADVNAYYYEIDNRKKRDKTIQPHVIGEDISNIRLLGLYGADVNEVNFNEKNSYLKAFILRNLTLFCERKNLETQLSFNPSNEEKILIYDKLAIWWDTISKDENNSIYKLHYQSKSTDYAEKARALRSIIATAPNTPEISHSQSSSSNAVNEKQPLLAKFKAE